MELMLKAEKRAGPMPYKDGLPDSPRLWRLAFKVIRLNKYLQPVSLGNIEVDKDEKDNIIQDLKDAQLELQES